MKFFRFFLLLPILFITSCGDQYYYSEEVVMNTETIYYTVYPRDWVKVDFPPVGNELEDSGWTYFYYDFREPKLTNQVFNKGVMNAYLVTYDGQITVLTPLPFDNYYRDNYARKAWTEQVTCEFSPQNVRFIAKFNDFEVNYRNPLKYTFMVRLAW